MAAFFKKKEKASDIGDGLLVFALDEKDAAERVSELPIATEQERELVTHNLMALQIFTIDYAVTMLLGQDSSQKNAVLDGYYSTLKKVSDNLESKGAASYFEWVKRHLLDYTIALKTPHELGPPWTVGKEFARRCNKADDVMFINFGSLNFSAFIELVSKFLKKHRIKL